MATLMMLTLLVGCSNTATLEPEAKHIAQVTIGTTAKIETATRGEYNFDMLASGASEIPMVYQDTDGNFHPLMASYKTEDSVTWTYTVVEGMKWSDGEAVTAEDILFTLQYDDENGGANFVAQTNSDGKATEAKYAGYEISEDGMSISLTLASANVRELSNMTSFRVMPKHIYEGNANPTEEDMRTGCGPYMFEEFNKEAGTISFVVNPNYPGTPNVDKLVYQLFGNEDTMYMALQNGDIDMTWNYASGVATNYQDVLAENDTIALKNVPAAGAPSVLAFNNANGLFSDESLREAVSYALDYDVFKTYFGSAYAATPNRGFVPVGTVGFKETAALETNLGKAAELMATAGYTEKNSDGFYINTDGEVAGFTLTVNASKETHVGYAELVKTQLEEFGIAVTLDALDGDSYNAKATNKFSESNITTESAIYGYTPAGMGMMNGLATIYVDGTHPVQGGCQVYDAGFQAIKDKMSEAKVIEDYVAAAGEMQDFYAEHTPLIALYWDNMMYAYSAGLDNVVIDYTFGLNNTSNWFSITAK